MEVGVTGWVKKNFETYIETLEKGTATKRVEIFDAVTDALEKIESLPDTAPKVTPKIIIQLQDDLVVGTETINGKFPVTSSDSLAAIFDWTEDKKKTRFFTNAVVKKYFCFPGGSIFDDPQVITNARARAYMKHRKKNQKNIKQ